MNKKPDYSLVKPALTKDRELVELEKQNKQLTWFIQVEGKQIGIAWIDLEGNEYIESPNVYVTVNENFQRRGIGSSVTKEMIKYAYCNLTSDTLYSRYETSDAAAEKLHKKLGFENDEKPYTDSDGREWQNVTLVL
jgi:RimJ/RimL family protein N-acetyltransferase